MPSRAAAIAASALSASRANVSISRDTVGSEATRPNTAGSARTVAMSARQSPPRATAIARSPTIFPGSWIAVGRHHRPSAADSARSSPTLAIVATSSVAPAFDTTPVPAVSTFNDGYNPVGFLTRKVLQNLYGYGPQ